MSGVEDLLLYPLATGDHPVCPKCSSPLALVSFQSEHGMPDFTRFIFRCPDCGRSETFVDEDHAAPRSRRKVREGLIELPPVDGSVGTEERVEGTKSLNDAYDEVRMRDGTAANELARLRSR